MSWIFVLLMFMALAVAALVVAALVGLAAAMTRTLLAVCLPPETPLRHARLPPRPVSTERRT